jgi:ferredoxin
MAEGGDTPCTKCSVGGPAVAKKLATLLGQDAGDMEKKVAFVMCNGTTDNAAKLYEYEDISSCKAAKQLFGGSKQCPYGCIGLGDCVAACEFDAIRIIDGVAVVGRDYCTSCGACAKACPQKLIKIIPESAKVQVRCHNEQKGADARKACNVACIGCGQCARVCPKGAITIENNLSSIDPSKCIKCGLCAAKCPTGAIQDVMHTAEQKEKIKKGLQAKEAKEAAARKEAALKAKAAKEAAAKTAAEAKAEEAPKA